MFNVSNPKNTSLVVILAVSFKIHQNYLFYGARFINYVTCIVK